MCVAMRAKPIMEDTVVYYFVRFIMQQILLSFSLVYTQKSTMAANLFSVAGKVSFVFATPRPTH